MNERAMYERLAEAFQRRGFVTIKQFSFQHPLVRDYEDYRPQADLAAFRWASDVRLDAVAVEAKLGEYPDSPLWAVNQATTYQLLFPSVYVATETGRESLDFSEEVLRALGLGYICVGAEGATFVFRPVANGRCYEELYSQSVRPAAILALLAEKFLEESWKSNASAGHFYVWTEAQDRVQLQLGMDEGNVYFGCYSDIKPVCRGVSERADPQQVAACLGHVPKEYERSHGVWHAKRLPNRQLDYEACGNESAEFNDSANEIRDAFKKAREWCGGSRRLGALGFRFKLWDCGQFMTRSGAESRLEALFGPVTDLREYLNSLLTS